MEYDQEPPFGAVLTAHRGQLPFALLHGESLVACSAWALGAADVDLVDLTVPWSAIRESGRALALHDSLCPATPPDFIAECVRRAIATDEVVVAVRPVTDTLKRREGDLVGATVDRDSVLSLASPYVVPARVVEQLATELPSEPVALVQRLRQLAPITWVEAPEAARRVADADDLGVLAAATSPRG